MNLSPTQNWEEPIKDISSEPAYKDKKTASSEELFDKTKKLLEKGKYVIWGWCHSFMSWQKTKPDVRKKLNSQAKQENTIKALGTIKQVSTTKFKGIIPK